MTAQTILPANSVVDTGFNVDNSARFDGSSYLHRTPSATGNPKKWTYSVWVKMAPENPGYFLSSGSGTQSKFIFGAYGGADIDILTYEGYVVNANTARLFRDSSAWYHMVLAVDTTQSAAANGVKLYINGVQETLTFNTEGSENGYTQDTSLRVGTNNEPIHIGRDINDAGHWKGYMAECALVNDAQLAPTSFGEFDSDSGIWKPIDISGLTFGTNGFHLDFKDSSAFGNDVSGNNNDFTVVGLAATDQSTDTCTNNFTTMNPLAYRLDSGVSLPTYSEGNTVVSYADDSGAGKSTMATIGFQNGKWYWEYKVGTANDTIFGGITRMDYDPNDNFAGRSCYYNKTGAFSVGTGTGGTADANYGDSYTTDDIIGVAFDCDNGVIWFSKNGTWQNSATIAEIGAGTTTNSATTGITLNQFWSPFFEGANGGISANFGSPAYAISSGNTDGDGYGNFEYAVPSGYFAINTKNLAEYG